MSNHYLSEYYDTVRSFKTFLPFCIHLTMLMHFNLTCTYFNLVCYILGQSFVLASELFIVYLAYIAGLDYHVLLHKKIRSET